MLSPKRERTSWLEIARGFALFPPFNSGNPRLSRGLCGRLLHAIFPPRTRSDGPLSLDGQVRGQRMTTDRSRIALIRPLVSGMSFILARSLLCACPARFFLTDTSAVFLRARHIDWQETATCTRQSQCQDGSRSKRSPRGSQMHVLSCQHHARLKRVPLFL